MVEERAACGWAGVQRKRIRTENTTNSLREVESTSSESLVANGVQKNTSRKSGRCTTNKSNRTQTTVTKNGPD